MPSKEFDRSLTSMVSTGLSKVKEAVSVRVRVSCKDCGGYKGMFDSSPCPHPGAHDGQQFDHDVRITTVESSKRPALDSRSQQDVDEQQRGLTLQVKQVPKEQHITREQHIARTLEAMQMVPLRRDGGRQRNEAQRAPSASDDPLKKRFEAYYESIAYEQRDDDELTDIEKRVDPIPKYFIERRD